jgi:hypothetical protein
MSENERAERPPDATMAFGRIGANETDERPGVHGAPDAAGAAAGGGDPAAELPPLASAEIDATPVRLRFTDGGERS